MTKQHVSCCTLHSRDLLFLWFRCSRYYLFHGRHKPIDIGRTRQDIPPAVIASHQDAPTQVRGKFDARTPRDKNSDRYTGRGKVRKAVTDKWGLHIKDRVRAHAIGSRQDDEIKESNKEGRSGQGPESGSFLILRRRGVQSGGDAASDVDSRRQGENEPHPVLVAGRGRKDDGRVLLLAKDKVVTHGRLFCECAVARAPFAFSRVVGE